MVFFFKRLRCHQIDTDLKFIDEYLVDEVRVWSGSFTGEVGSAADRRGTVRFVSLLVRVVRLGTVSSQPAPRKAGHHL